MEILLIAVLGFVMGIVTSISGGAGVFAVPTLLAFGIPPVNALALNRMSDVGVVLGALRNYWKSRSIDWKLAFKIMPIMAVGSFAGAKVIINVPTEYLKHIVLGGVIIGMIILLRPTRPLMDKHESTPTKMVFGYFLMLLVGIWGGALAMAGATFAVLVLVYLFGKKFVEARSTDIAAAIPETLIATTILTMASTVSYLWLLTMFISSFCGAFLGSHMAVKRGDAFVKKSMIAIGIVMIAKIIFEF